MLQRSIIYSLAALFFFCGLVSQGFSSNSGPDEMKLTSTNIEKSKKPAAVFPHKKHQEASKCGECHHSIKDGKQTPYTEGMEIQKCETCHNSDILAGKKRGKNKLDTFKGAAHENCLGCHKDVAKKNADKKKLKSCKTCHQK